MREGVNHPSDGHAEGDEHQEAPGGGARALFRIAAMQSAQGQRRHQREEHHQLEVGEFHLAIADVWWTVGDSNPRPPRCERGALPAELTAHWETILAKPESKCEICAAAFQALSKQPSVLPIENRVARLPDNPGR